MNVMRGPYWRSLVEAWEIVQNNVITFRYDSWSWVFEIKVSTEDNERKPWVRYPGMFKIGLNFEIIDLVVCSLQVYF
jgi:hypothetical protein